MQMPQGLMAECYKNIQFVASLSNSLKQMNKIPRIKQNGHTSTTYAIQLPHSVINIHFSKKCTKMIIYTKINLFFLSFFTKKCRFIFTLLTKGSSILWCGQWGLQKAAISEKVNILALQPRKDPIGPCKGNTASFLHLLF